jgi:hypothetical protein
MYILNENENIQENTSIELSERVMFNFIIFTWCIVIFALYQYINYERILRIKFKYF